MAVESEGWLGPVYKNLMKRQADGGLKQPLADEEVDWRGFPWHPISNTADNRWLDTPEGLADSLEKAGESGGVTP